MKSLASKPNVDTTDPDFPLGKILDDSGAGDGTPVSQEVYNDIHTFFETMMADAGITANGLFDNDNDGYQLLEALKGVVIGVIANTFQWVNAGTSFGFTPNSGTATVQTSDVIYNKYLIVGKMFAWHIKLRGVNITGTPSLLRFAIPSTLSGAGYKIVNKNCLMHVGNYSDSDNNRYAQLVAQVGWNSNTAAVSDTEIELRIAPAAPPFEDTLGTGNNIDFDIHLMFELSQ